MHFDFCETSTVRETGYLAIYEVSAKNATSRRWREKYKAEPEKLERQLKTLHKY